MRYLFPILLLFLFFESVITTKSLKQRMATAAKALKIISDRKRKLEATDVITSPISKKAQLPEITTKQLLIKPKAAMPQQTLPRSKTISQFLRKEPRAIKKQLKSKL